MDWSSHSRAEYAQALHRIAGKRAVMEGKIVSSGVEVGSGIAPEMLAAQSNVQVGGVAAECAHLLPEFRNITRILGSSDHAVEVD